MTESIRPIRADINRQRARFLAANMQPQYLVVDEYTYARLRQYANESLSATYHYGDYAEQFEGLSIIRAHTRVYTVLVVPQIV